MKTYTVSSVAEELGVCEATVRNWIKSGKLNAEKTGAYGAYIITEDDLDRAFGDEETDEPESEQEGVYLDDEKIDELLLNQIDKMIAEYERQRDIIDVKLQLLYRAEEMFEAY